MKQLLLLAMLISTIFALETDNYISVGNTTYFASSLENLSAIYSDSASDSLITELLDTKKVITLKKGVVFTISEQYDDTIKVKVKNVDQYFWTLSNGVELK